MTILDKRIVILLRTTFIILTLLACSFSCYAGDLSSQNLKIHASLSEYNYNSNVEIEKLFRENLNDFGNIIYTIIPMGVVVSIDGYAFYGEGKDTLTPNACCLLDIIARLIKTIDKPCIVESNTTSTAFETSTYLTNWELSLVRANNIVSYLISKEISPDKIRANGFGEMFPFISNPQNNMQERIDFVIFNYEKRN